MEATVRTTWSIDWTAKGRGDIVVAGEDADGLLVDWLMDGGVVAWLPMNVVGLADLGCGRVRPHFDGLVIDYCVTSYVHRSP